MVSFWLRLSTKGCVPSWPLECKISTICGTTARSSFGASRDRPICLWLNLSSGQTDSSDVAPQAGPEQLSMDQDRIRRCNTAKTWANTGTAPVILGGEMLESGPCAQAWETGAPKNLCKTRLSKSLWNTCPEQRLPTAAYRNSGNTLPEELVHDTSTPTIAQQVADTRLKRMIQKELLQDPSLQKQVSRI